MSNISINYQRKSIPVGCGLPALHHTRGSLSGGPPGESLLNRDPNDQGPPGQRPLGQRSVDRDPHRDPLDRDPLDRDPLDRDPWTETPWLETSWTETRSPTETPQRPPGQRPLRQRPPGQRPLDRDPWTETPLEGTWEQAARQEVTSYRDPLWTDRHLWKHYLDPDFICGR